MEYTDAVNLLAGIVEQARRDVKPQREAVGRCDIDYPHGPRRCAREFLAALDTQIKHSPRRMTTTELAQTVMEVIEE